MRILREYGLLYLIFVKQERNTGILKGENFENRKIRINGRIRIQQSGFFFRLD